MIGTNPTVGSIKISHSRELVTNRLTGVWRTLLHSSAGRTVPQRQRLHRRLWVPRDPPPKLPASEVLGTTHSNGQYHFTDNDFLDEGAEQLSQLGTNVINVWFHRVTEKYSYISDWGGLLGH